MAPPKKRTTGLSNIKVNTLNRQWPQLVNCFVTKSAKERVAEDFFFQNERKRNNSLPRFLSKQVEKQKKNRWCKQNKKNLS